MFGIFAENCDTIFLTVSLVNPIKVWDYLRERATRPKKWNGGHQIKMPNVNIARSTPLPPRSLLSPSLYSISSSLILSLSSLSFLFFSLLLSPPLSIFSLFSLLLSPPLSSSLSSLSLLSLFSLLSPFLFLSPPLSPLSMTYSFKYS